MRVIPVEALFTSDRELVGKVPPRSDWILYFVRKQTFISAGQMLADLCYSGNFIHLCCSTLKETWYQDVSIDVLMDKLNSR